MFAADLGPLLIKIYLWITLFSLNPELGIARLHPVILGVSPIVYPLFSSEALNVPPIATVISHKAQVSHLFSHCQRLVTSALLYAF